MRKKNRRARRRVEARQWAKCRPLGEEVTLRDHYENQRFKHELSRVEKLQPEEVLKLQLDWIGKRDRYLADQVHCLYHLLPEKVRREVYEERRDYMVYEPVYSPFDGKLYWKRRCKDARLLYLKILEKLRKTGMMK